ncbi:MAG: methyltransferase, partial [Myxococcota bacterium]
MEHKPSSSTNVKDTGSSHETGWEQAWQEQNTPWDTGVPAPALLQLLNTATDLPTGRALVPGCGSGYDAFALADAGYQVQAVDISQTAVEHFLNLRDQKAYTPQQVDAHCTDFFSFTPPQPYELIWDYTFLCAIPPSMRDEWAQQMKQLLAPQGELITLIFP